MVRKEARKKERKAVKKKVKVAKRDVFYRLGRRKVKKEKERVRKHQERKVKAKR